MNQNLSQNQSFNMQNQNLQNLPHQHYSTQQTNYLIYAENPNQQCSRTQTLPFWSTQEPVVDISKEETEPPDMYICVKPIKTSNIPKAGTSI